MTVPASMIASGSLVDLDATFAIQLGIFLVMFLLLRQLLFRPVMRLIEARRAATDGVQESSRSLREEAERLSADVARQLLEIRSSASAERERMIEQARRQERDLLASARDQAVRVSEEARKDAERQSDAVLTTLRRETETLALATAAKVLGRQI